MVVHVVPLFDPCNVQDYGSLSGPSLAEVNISDIPGEHYRMTKKQFNYIISKFDFSGIPSYLIINKKGEQVYSHMGFESAEKISGLLNDKLNK